MSNLQRILVIWFGGTCHYWLPSIYWLYFECYTAKRFVFHWLFNGYKSLLYARPVIKKNQYNEKIKAGIMIGPAIYLDNPLSGFTDIRSTMKTPDIFKYLFFSTWFLDIRFWIFFNIQFQTLRNFKCLQSKKESAAGAIRTRVLWHTSREC